ncbi:hypothetical protein M513_09309 [Trichuris suis]|uniref:Uncharacterized protein n=1 Tax=Trichuris suis TaxID=68888 RepID=A0A085LXZ6_9BILA|nr:hypothetical protein M513_09309 [Trichuris suis]
MKDIAIAYGALRDNCVRDKDLFFSTFSSLSASHPDTYVNRKKSSCATIPCTETYILIYYLFLKLRILTHSLVPSHQLALLHTPHPDTTFSSVAVPILTPHPDTHGHRSERSGGRRMRVDLRSSGLALEGSLLDSFTASSSPTVSTGEPSVSSSVGLRAGASCRKETEDSRPSGSRLRVKLTPMDEFLSHARHRSIAPHPCRGCHPQMIYPR